MANEKYRLIGSMCLFPTYPEFVYPVFEREGKFYFQVCEEATIIDDFSEIRDDEHLALIRPLQEIPTRLGSIPKEFARGDNALIAFQPDESTVFFGNMEAFRTYLKKNPVKDEFVQEQIHSLKAREKNSKQYRKKKDFQNS